MKSATIIKLPRASKKVDGTLKRVHRVAMQQGWDKVIVIGKGKDWGGYRCSENISQAEFLGMLEEVKFNILFSC